MDRKPLAKRQDKANTVHSCCLHSSRNLSLGCQDCEHWKWLPLIYVTRALAGESDFVIDDETPETLTGFVANRFLAANGLLTLLAS